MVLFNGFLKLPKSTHRWWISDWFIVCECENPQHADAPCLVSRDTQTLQLIGEMSITELWDGLGGKGPESPSSATPAMAGTPPAVPGCSKPCPAWPWTLPGMGSPQLFGQHVPGLPHPHSEEFPSNLPSSPALWHWEAIPCVLSLHSLSPVPPQLSWSPFRPCKGL